MDKAELLAALRAEVEGANWRQTNYIDPHEYVLRKDCPTLCALLDVAISQHGYNALFMGKHPGRYFNLDGWRYWGWGRILNRAINTEDKRHVVDWKLGEQ